MKHANYFSMLALFLATFNALMFTLGTVMDFFDIGVLVALVVDVFIVIGLISAYLLAALKIKRYRREAKNKQILELVDNTVSRLAKLVLLSIALFDTIYIILHALYHIAYPYANDTWRSWLEFGFYFSVLIAHTNSVVNAVIFVSVNKRARKAFIRNWKGNTILNPVTVHPTSESQL